jgi:hypothetical protein
LLFGLGAWVVILLAIFGEWATAGFIAILLIVAIEIELRRR